MVCCSQNYIKTSESGKVLGFSLLTKKKTNCWSVVLFVLRPELIEQCYTILNFINGE